MNIKRFLVDALTVFSVSMVVSIAVTLLWSLMAHKAGTIDWESSLRFAIPLGIIVPWIGARRRSQK